MVGGHERRGPREEVAMALTEFDESRGTGSLCINGYMGSMPTGSHEHTPMMVLLHQEPIGMCICICRPEVPLINQAPMC